MRFISLCLMWMASALLVSACAAPAVTAQSGRTAADPIQSFAEEYKLGVGDKIRIIVYNEDTMSGEFQVNSGGQLSLPLIGDVNAIGQTTAQLGAAIQSRLADGYLRDPHVSVEILIYRPYFILGEIKAPAQYPYINGMTVVNAVATAGGFTPRAARKKVYIRRSGEDEEKIYTLNADLRVYPGDTIRVGERYF